MNILNRAKNKWNSQADEFNQWRELCAEEKIDLLNAESLQAGDVVYFSKSGNRVRLISSSGDSEYVAERIDGESIGKQMICKATALRWALSGGEIERLEALESGTM